MGFKDWLKTEGGMGSGTKVTMTGMNAGGQAQAGMGMSKPGSPQKQAVNIMSPSDLVPKGWKPQPGPGGLHGIFRPAQFGISGAGIMPPKKMSPIGAWKA
jgi:hypothetical protein